MQLRVAPDVGLVDHGLAPRMARRSVVLPVEVVVDHDRPRDRIGVVDVVDLQIRFVVPLIGNVRQHARALELDRSFDRLRVRVDQQLRRVEPLPLLRRVGAVDAVAVALPGTHTGQVAVPVQRRPLYDLHLLLLVGFEQAEHDALGVLAEQREVRPRAVPGGAEWERPARPDLSHRTTAPASGGNAASPSSIRTPSCVAKTSSPPPTGTRRSSRAKLHASSTPARRTRTQRACSSNVTSSDSPAPSSARKASSRAYVSRTPGRSRRVSFERSNVAGSCGSGTSLAEKVSKLANSRRRPSRVAIAMSSSM